MELPETGFELVGMATQVVGALAGSWGLLFVLRLGLGIVHAAYRWIVGG